MGWLESRADYTPVKTLLSNFYWTINKHHLSVIHVRSSEPRKIEMSVHCKLTKMCANFYMLLSRHLFMGMGFITASNFRTLYRNNAYFSIVSNAWALRANGLMEPGCSSNAVLQSRTQPSQSPTFNLERPLLPYNRCMLLEWFPLAVTDIEDIGLWNKKHNYISGNIFAMYINF